jgi:hypothetical protein|tara:strand:- start:128 stop:364 length:237 start_codon:yes stop_codon:yes gene_type:complete
MDIRSKDQYFQDMQDVLNKKMNNALTVKDLTQADVVNIGDLAAMDLMTSSMLRTWAMLASKAIADSKAEVLRTTFDFN